MVRQSAGSSPAACHTRFPVQVVGTHKILLLRRVELVMYRSDNCSHPPEVIELPVGFNGIQYKY